MGDRDPGSTVALLFLTTRDLERPRTGADNRAAYLHRGISEAFAVDRVFFDRTGAGPGGPDSVPYPPSELLAVLSVRFLLAVVRTVRSDDYEAVVVSGIGAVPYGVVAALLAGTPLVFDDHNVEHDLARDASLPRFVVVYLLERVGCAFARLVVVPTTEVAEALAPWIRGEVEVVTNGFDAETFTPDGAAAEFEGTCLLFFGNFRYEPNLEAVECVVETLAPRLARADVDARVLLAGPGHEALDVSYELPPEVEVLGFVEDLPATIRGVELVVVPLRSGSGSRLKIIESLACGTRVVSTPLGAAGWPTDWHNLVLADLDGFAETTLAALADPGFDRAELDAIGRYSWEAQSRRFVEALERVVR